MAKSAAKAAKAFGVMWQRSSSPKLSALKETAAAAAMLAASGIWLIMAYGVSAAVSHQKAKMASAASGMKAKPSSSAAKANGAAAWRQWPAMAENSNHRQREKPSAAA
jgi:hypothetical protein